jgi:hypothetical protein
LKKDPARVSEERDILKKGETILRHWSEDNARTRTSPVMQSEVRVYGRASASLFGLRDVSLPAPAIRVISMHGLKTR